MPESHFGRQARNRSETATTAPKKATTPDTTTTRVLVHPRKSQTLGSTEDAFCEARAAVSWAFFSCSSEVGVLIGEGDSRAVEPPEVSPLRRGLAKVPPPTATTL